MSQVPSLTINMVAYNEERYLSTAVQSLLEQTYSDFRLIIADNGSTDFTGQIADDFARRDPRVSVIHTERNDPQYYYKMLDNSTSPYLMGAAGHDYYAPDFITRCIAPLMADPEVVLAYPRARWLKGEDVLDDIPGLIDTTNLNPVSRSILVSYGLIEAYQAYGIYRADALKSLTRHKVIGYDHVFLTELALLGTFALVDEPLFFMRMAENFGDPAVYRKKHFPDEPDGIGPFLRMVAAYMSTADKAGNPIDRKIMKLAFFTSGLLRYRHVLNMFGESVESLFAKPGFKELEGYLDEAVRFIEQDLQEEYAGRTPETANDSTHKARVRIAGEVAANHDLTAVGGESEFADAISQLFAQIRPRKIIETGTYHGDGTTRIIAGTLKSLGIEDAVFCTIECNPDNYRQAHANLTRSGLIGGVNLLHGLSVPRSKLPTIEEIEKSCVSNIEFDDIFVDHQEQQRALLYYRETDFTGVDDDMLGKALQIYGDRPDFVLLDSGGHMGNVEFNYLISRLKGPCYLALDDIYHIKHHKSFCQMQSDPRFELLVTSQEKFGFCIAKFTPDSSATRREIREIIWLRPDSIGDAILSSSMLPHIRNAYDGARITVFCQEHIAELYEACPDVASIITFNKERAYSDETYRVKILSHLKAVNADLLLNSVYSREPLTDYFALGCGAQQSIVIDGDLSNLTADLHESHTKLYSEVLPSSSARKNELSRHRDFLDGLGIKVDELKTTAWVTQEDISFASNLFHQHGLNPAKTIVLFAGAQYDVRLYGRYDEALDPVCREHGMSVIALGSEGDRDISQRNLDRIGVRTLNLCGMTTLRQSAALISRCRLAVGAETGLAHLACAVDTPNVVLLGGGHFGRFMPYSPLTTVACLPLECYGCNWRCKYQHSHCVRDLAPSVLEQAVRITLSCPGEQCRVVMQNPDTWTATTGVPNWKRNDGYIESEQVRTIVADACSSASRAHSAPLSAINVFPESALAHKWLDGLAGLEIGASSHNPFGLITRNVGLHFDGYDMEQRQLTGYVAPLDVVAPAEDIPLPDDSEDFVLSSHVLEHCPDMIKTLVEWYRLIREGGYLFMIIPFRDSAPTDRGRPLTEWAHIVADYLKNVNAEIEPEANGIPFGYCHYHVFDIETVNDFVTRIFDDRLELVDYQQRDDKAGNGFTLVYRKRKSFTASFPWTILNGTHRIDIHRPSGGVSSLGKFIIATNLVPFTNEGQRSRQDASIASITRLASTDITPLNICFPDERLEPDGWHIAPMIQRSANQELQIEGKRKPFVRDLFDIAASWATKRGIEWFVFTNSDIIMTASLIDEIKRHMTAGYDTVAVSRNEVERIEADGTLVPGYLEVNGYDVFVCRVAWWQAHRHLFQPYIFGERAWDDAYAAIMACHSRFTMLYRNGLCFHFKHATNWLTGPYAAYNMGIYTGTDKPYSDRYEAFIYEVLATDRRQLTPQKTELLLKTYFPSEGTTPLTSAGAVVQPFVNICIITYNRLDFTRQCLDAVERTVDYPHVITVVDNNSQDGTREYLQDLHRRGVIKNLVLLDENVGVAKASNLAWSLEPGAGYYLKLDNDIVMQNNGWLSEMVKTIDGLPELGAVACNFEPTSYPLQNIGGFRVRIKPHGNLGGACTLIPRRTFDRLGYWCEDYGLYGEEDFDYGCRILLAGLQNAYLEDEEAGFHLPAGRAAHIDMQTFVASDGIEESTFPHYRQWKDAQRKQNVESGLIEQNLSAYRRDPSRLYVHSTFVSRWDVTARKAIHAGTAARPLSEHNTPSRRQDHEPRAASVPPYVNIGMITYNRLEFTRQAIDALIRFTDYPYALTVVDNNSQDGTRDYLKDLHARGIIRNLVLLDENVGVAKASNLAWHLEPDAPYYMKLDNDIVIQKPGWLRPLVEAVDKISDLGAVGYNFEPRSFQLQEIAGQKIRIKPYGNLGGACILIPRRTSDLIGYWCEEYGLYSDEDYDYGCRITLSGLYNAYMEDEMIGIHLPAGRAAVIDPETLVASDGQEEISDREYRQWKDDRRRENEETGIVQQNITRYKRDAASRHIGSRFAEEWLKLHDVDRVRYQEHHTETFIDKTSAPFCPTLVQEGLNLKQERRYQEALEAFTAALSRGDVSVHVHRGDCLANLGRVEESEKAYLDALGIDDGDPLAHAGLGVLKLLQQQYHSAAEAFEKALLFDPNSSKALCGLGMARSGMGNGDEAFVLFKRAMDADPENLTALYELLKAGYQLDRLAEAEPYLQGYLRYHPGNGDMLFSHAGVLYALDRLDDARDTLDGLMALSPGYEGAFELLSKIEEKELSRLARRLAADGNLDDALGVFGQLAEKGCRSFLTGQGDCLAKLGRFGEAAATYRESLACNDKDVKAMMGLGVVHLLQENPDEAASWFNRAIRLEPDNCHVLTGMGMTRALQGENCDALILFTKALDIDPEHLTALHELLKIGYQSESLSAVEPYVQGYLMYHPTNSHMLFSLAGLQYRLGKFNEARDNLERLLIIEPDYHGGADLLKEINRVETGHTTAELMVAGA